MRADYGSMVGYVEAIGVGADVVDALRANLLH